MDVSGVSKSGYTPLPTFQDMAVVLAARSSMAEMSAKTAAQVSATVDGAADATRSASTVSDGKVDLYL